MALSVRELEARLEALAKRVEALEAQPAPKPKRVTKQPTE